MNTAMETRSLSFAYAPGRWALRDVNLRFPAGSKTVLLGANGAGKSTLLLLLAGVQHACLGSVSVDGLEQDQSRAGKRAWRSKVGMLLQDPEDQLLAPTVEQDVALAPMQAGHAEADVRRQVAEMLESLGIERLANRPVHELSVGEKKRVALAGVLISRPRVLLLDEPTSGLDPMGSRLLLRELDRLAAGGLTVVQSTHDMDLAYEWPDRVCLLCEGGVLAQGSPNSVLTDRALLEVASLEAPRAVRYAMGVIA